MKKIEIFSHNPVLLKECVEGLEIKPEGIYVDATVGGAGHSIEIARKLEGGRLFAFDRDPDAVSVSKKRLSSFPALVINSNFCEMKKRLEAREIREVDGILIDLGVSSYQLDNPKRGFSYRHDGALDMRMSKQGVTAAEIVNKFSEEELVEILKKYGQERFARSIASNIVKRRSQKLIQTTLDLANIIKFSIPAKFRRRKNPCKKSFQAIRIVVNGELDNLELGLEASFELLKAGGRLVVITFHSLEDRLVKQKYKIWSRGCVCPPKSPICVCGNVPPAKIVNKKAIRPSDLEIATNPRSKSAKLRILEKL